MRVGKIIVVGLVGDARGRLRPGKRVSVLEDTQSGGSNGNGNGMNANGKDKKHPGGGSSIDE